MPADASGEAARERELHQRLLAADPTAPSEFITEYLEGLVAELSRAFPRVEDHVLYTAAIDLLLRVARQPGEYNPAKGRLGRYLRMAAYRDVQNALRSETRRSRRIISLDDVELWRRAGNRELEGGDDPARVALVKVMTEGPTVALIRAAFNDTEWELLGLMIEDERHTAVYAELLGLQDRPAEEQAREVKKVKDRVWKRFKRVAARVREHEQC